MHRNQDYRGGVMTHTNNPVLDAEFLAEIRSRETIARRSRMNYELIEREKENGRIEHDCEAPAGHY